MDMSAQEDLIDPPNTAATVHAAAAYHGPAWSPRQGSFTAELRDGRLWRPCGAGVEWDPLRTVQLTLPDPAWPGPESWDAIQYLAPVNFAALRAELTAYGATLTGLGVEVLIHDLNGLGDRPMYNGVFVRDQYWMTPEGAMLARMGSAVRAGEERYAAAALAAAGVPLRSLIRGTARFEGADALWITEDTLLIGVGNRTDSLGAEQVAHLAKELGSRTFEVAMPREIQHLLGLMRPIAPDLVVVRTDRAPARLLELLESRGLRVLGLPDSDEVRMKQALNFTVLEPRRVVMADGCPETRDWLESRGVEVAAVVPCPHLRRAAGGLACATGIIHREGSGNP